jgi:hypothetical protein
LYWIIKIREADTDTIWRTFCRFPVRRIYQRGMRTKKTAIREGKRKEKDCHTGNRKLDWVRGFSGPSARAVF